MKSPIPLTAPNPVAVQRLGNDTAAPQKNITIIHGAHTAEKRATPLKPYAATNTVTAARISVRTTDPALVGYHSSCTGSPKGSLREVEAIAVIAAA